MALQSSGQISLNDVNVELGNSGTAQIDMNSSAVRGLFDIASGEIEMADGYGKTDFISSVIQEGHVFKNNTNTISDAQAGDFVIMLTGCLSLNSSSDPDSHTKVSGFTDVGGGDNGARTSSTQWNSSSPYYYTTGRLQYRILDGTETSFSFTNNTGNKSSVWHQYRFSGGAITSVHVSDNTGNGGGSFSRTEAGQSTNYKGLLRVIGVAGRSVENTTQTISNTTSDYPLSHTKTSDYTGNHSDDGDGHASMATALVWTTSTMTSSANATFHSPTFCATIRLD